MGGRSRGKRVLAPDEVRLWQRVAASAEPLDKAAERAASHPGGDGADDGAAGWGDLTGLPPVPAAPADPHPAPPVKSRAHVRSRAAPPVSASLLPPEARPVGRPEAGLDRRTAERMRKGGRAPDARLDLHGMTAERAHRACLAFLSDSLAKGHRMVLVITGKGRARGGEGGGVLRRALPGWLRASSLGGQIVGLYQAHQRHGGDGAFYVYLKRRR